MSIQWPRRLPRRPSSSILDDILGFGGHPAWNRATASAITLCQVGSDRMSTTSIPTPVPTAAAATVPEAPRPAAAQRLVSLDAFRGFTMFWLLGGKAFVLAIAGLGLSFVSDFL